MILWARAWEVASLSWKADPKKVPWSAFNSQDDTLIWQTDWLALWSELNTWAIEGSLLCLQGVSVPTIEQM